MRPYGLSQYVFVDSSTQYNGQNTLRVGQDTDAATNGGTQDDRAVYATGGSYGWFTVKQGDHIYFSTWIKTDHSSQGNDGKNTEGARIGIDFYTDSGRVPTMPPNVPTVRAGSFVPWGTSGWTQIKFDITVPSGYSITGFMPWFQVLEKTDSGNAWYANTELYINP